MQPSNCQQVVMDLQTLNCTIPARQDPGAYYRYVLYVLNSLITVIPVRIMMLRKPDHLVRNGVSLSQLWLSSCRFVSRKTLQRLHPSSLEVVSYLLWDTTWYKVSRLVSVFAVCGPFLYCVIFGIMLA
ncbi:hypothetical protein GGR57DRAFT_448915 [Xylariaceae sp. FL1272]|nr:hypothetical protein GGR57DRAFT_448915 [Xylariaceae sp. FL1272]